MAELKEVRVGASYRHKNGNVYLVTGKLKLRCPHTGLWHDAVTYCPTREPGTAPVSQQLYTRDEESFKSSFNLYTK